MSSSPTPPSPSSSPTARRSRRARPPHAGAITEASVDRISALLGEPEWMRGYRRRSLAAFQARPLPTWGGDLSEIDFTALRCEPERRAPTVAVSEELTALGVIVCDLATAAREHEATVREWFGTVVPFEDNLFAALNGAVWGGGWFVHVPRGVALDRPIAVPRGLAPAPAGCFDRTLIVVEEDASAELAGDGATEPGVGGGTLRGSVVELVARAGARVSYAAVQSWPRDVYDLATHRAAADAGASVRWVDVTVGARLTMRYPSVLLRGDGAAGEVVSVAIAGRGQHQDVGGKLVCSAPSVTGRITSYSIAGAGGRATFRGLVRIAPGASGAACDVRGESLRLDLASRVDAYPYIEVDEPGTRVSQQRGSALLDEERVAALVRDGVERSEAVARVAAEFIAPVADRLGPAQRGALWAAVRDAAGE